MNAFSSQRSRVGIVLPALLMLVSSFVIPAEPVMAQSGCPGTPVYDTTPSPLTGIINAYYPGREPVASAGDTTIFVGLRTGSTTTDLAAGNLALIIQMQDADFNRTNTSSYGDGVSGGAGAGSTALNSTGLYEYVRVVSITGTATSTNRTVVISGAGPGGGLVNSYRGGAPVDTGGTRNGQRSYQVIRVPQYLNATVAAGLTAKAWGGPIVDVSGRTRNGPTGGVLAFDVAGTLTLAGQTVSVNGLGFRGGGGRQLAGDVGTSADYLTYSTINANGSKGEGIAGTPRYVWNAASAALVDNTAEGYPEGSYGQGAPGNGGGGGTDGDPNPNDENSGGGGGGNCGTGGRGGNAWEDQDTSGGWGGAGSSPTVTRMFMGGGGGAGSTNNGSRSGGPENDDGYSSGGAGGGIILVRAYTMSGTGTFTANGADAPFDTGRDGAGGGGAGGTVGLTFRFADRNNITATANGGNGGDAWPTEPRGTFPGACHGPGGGGGGGFVATSGTIGTTSVTGGINGITTTSNEDYGATDGTAGCSDTTYVFTMVPGVSGGGECLNVSDVDMVQAEAKLFDTGALLSWTTASESENLGFNIYRNRDGVRERINRGLVAGAALKTTATMRAGHSYVWWDPDATASSQYWIEDVGFRGTGTMYGPYFPYAVTGASPVATRSATLGSKHAEDIIETSGQVVWSDDMKNAPGANAKGGGSTGAPPATPVATQWAIAGRPALKLSVSSVGWYRVSAADLASAGIDPSLFDPRTIKLFADGVQIPIQVSGESDGRFDSGDAVEFFGSGVDTPYTNTRVYYLTAGDGTGLRMKVVPYVAGPPVRASFPSTVELKKRTTHFSALANGETENFFGDVVAFAPRDQVLSLPHVDPTGTTAKLEVALQGVTLVPHKVAVSVNATSVGEVAFANKENAKGVFNVPASLLASGDNTITLTPDSTSYDVSLVDVVRVTYSRLPLSDGSPIAASVPGGRQVLSFGGFATAGVRVVDATNLQAPQEILGAVAPGASGFEIAFRQPVTTSRLLAFTPDQVRSPDKMVFNAPSTWNQRQSYDVVFLTTSELASTLTPLVQLRQGQGYRVAVVDIEDVFDEFGFGYRSPAAVRAFIDRARTAWSPGLKHVMIAGDASLDPRNYQGRGGNLVPTKSVETFSMETFSDDWMADVNGDDVPDVAIGRLPVISVAELETVVGKILAYEAQPAATRTILSVADTGDTYDFGEASGRMSGVVPVPSVVTSVHRSEIGDTAARSAILDSLHNGKDLVVYAGHGSVTFWRGGLLTSDDVMAIDSSGRLSVSVLANCLNGYFAAPGLHSVGEALVLAPGGGSVVSYSSSGTSDSGWQELLISEFLRVAYQPGMTTGDAARAAKASVNGDVRKTWVLLGDPLVKLK